MKSVVTEDCRIALLSSDSVELNALSFHDDWFVRARTASNVHTSVETLDRLAEDSDSDVRYHVAKNKNTSFQALIRLSIDVDELVRLQAKTNLMERDVLNELLDE